MHHITKSLFVGAAVAGIGMSSGRAELQIKESSKTWTRRNIEYYVDKHYDELRKCLPKELNLYIREIGWDSTDYESDATYKAWKEEDVQTIFDSLFREGGYLSHFEDAEDYLNAYNGDPRKTLKKFFKATFSFEYVAPDFLGKAIERKTLNLMRFLKKVASRCGGCAFNITNCHLSIGNKCFDTLKENGMIKRVNGSS